MNLTRAEYDDLDRAVCDGLVPDPTPYGMGSDHCAVCGADWKQPHFEDCDSPWAQAPPLDSRKALKELARLMRPRADAQQAAIMKLGEAKKHGEALADNDSLESFTKVKVTYAGDNTFRLDIITENHNTLGPS